MIIHKFSKISTHNLDFSIILNHVSWQKSFFLLQCALFCEWTLVQSCDSERCCRIPEEEKRDDATIWRVQKNKRKEKKTNGENINPAKTKVSVFLADLTFSCARARVCLRGPCFHRFKTEARKKRNGNIGKIVFVGVPGVHLVSADRRTRQGSEGTGSSG